MKSYCAYIMASHRRVLYIGFTGRLQARVKEHKTDFYPDSFTSRYRCHNLVYWEAFDEPVLAINREKELKKMKRAEKIALIERQNSKWKDLAAGWGRKFRVSDLKGLAVTGQQAGAVPADPSSRKERAPQDDSREREYFRSEERSGANLISLISTDQTNRLTLARVLALANEIECMARD